MKFNNHPEPPEGEAQHVPRNGGQKRR